MNKKMRVSPLGLNLGIIMSTTLGCLQCVICNSNSFPSHFEDVHLVSPSDNQYFGDAGLERSLALYWTISS